MSINVRLVKEGIIILWVYFSILGKLQNMILTVLWMKGMLTDFLSKPSKPGCELPLKVHSCKLLSSPGKVRGSPPVYTTIGVHAEPRLYSRCFYTLFLESMPIKGTVGEAVGRQGGMIFRSPALSGKWLFLAEQLSWAPCAQQPLSPQS